MVYVNVHWIFWLLCNLIDVGVPKKAWIISVSFYLGFIGLLNRTDSPVPLRHTFLAVGLTSSGLDSILISWPQHPVLGISRCLHVSWSHYKLPDRVFYQLLLCNCWSVFPGLGDVDDINKLAQSFVMGWFLSIFFTIDLKAPKHP